jgi:hypothetical protein
LPFFTVTLWSCTQADLIFFTVFDALATAVAVASSQLFLDEESTSITFTTDMLIFF